MEEYEEKLLVLIYKRKEKSESILKIFIKLQQLLFL